MFIDHIYTDVSCLLVAVDLAVLCFVCVCVASFFSFKDQEVAQVQLIDAALRLVEQRSAAVWHARSAHNKQHLQR